MDALSAVGYTIDQTLTLIQTFDSFHQIREGAVLYDDLLVPLGMPKSAGYYYLFRRCRMSAKDTISFRNVNRTYTEINLAM